MRIEYQLTADDYEEVSRRHSRVRPWVFMWFVGLMGCVMLAQNLIPARPASAVPARPSLVTDVLLPFLPWLVILIALWAVVFRMLRGDWRKPWLRRSRPKGEKRWFVITAFAVEIAAMIVLFVMAVRAQRTVITNPRESAVLDILVWLVPWAGVAVFMGIVFSRFRGVFCRSWDSQPHMHRPFVAEFDDDGVRLAERLSRHEYQWEYFPGRVETENLFVLYVSPLAFHIFPKRAFADDGERAEFATLLRRRVSERTNGFPVIPSDVRPLPPLPVAG
jgi:hypothetical protein